MSNAVGETKGRASQKRPGTEALIAGWQQAEALNAGRPEGAKYEYVPWEAVVVRDDLTPRFLVDAGAVEQYREVVDELPPIMVQQDTFVLIDGRHRLTAISQVSDCIKVIEIECSDADLFAAALKANKGHGVQLAQRERVAGAKRLLREHPEWSDTVIADIAGVSARSVWQYRQDAIKREEEQAAAEQREPEPERVAPVERVGADGAVRTVPIRPEAPRPAPKPSAGKVSRAQLAFSWMDALETAFEDAPDPEEIDPEWAAAAAVNLRMVEAKLMHAANEASRLALRYDDAARRTRADDEGAEDDGEAEQAPMNLGPVAVARRPDAGR